MTSMTSITGSPKYVHKVRT